MMDKNQSGVLLHLTPRQTAQGLQYQWLEIELTRSDRIIEPQALEDLRLPAGIDTTGGVVISGRAPIWLYSYLVHELHPTAWVACYDPRLGAVVVSTHSRLARIGQVIPIEPTGDRLRPHALCPALLVVGPPDSGKTVFSHSLFQALLPQYPDVYLQRAQWDGEGNYILELGPELTEPEREVFKAINRGQFTERFFPYQAQAILRLRRQKRLVIVDVGGMVQPEKQPLLEACSHYLIISSKPEAIAPWHEFCRDRGNLKPVAVLRSTLEDCTVVHQQEPYLDMTCGPWVHGKAPTMPDLLMSRIVGLLGTSSAVC
ncbi:CRISPR-associated protein Csx3 [Leptolyngbya sp. 'hensonii']|uniref:CRISPR-associated ring nuclease Crn3/Csx3 n=1 Tax=Leptolyngbya sp. 'hensonii' TaxID=1922337 RepID=UPI0009501E88|nr:CRISPR-associated ring nuclease Crn3/Csx3 [Leptolyngbya sp. 'hensonii']OLP19166.1 CRISPR-associated protein Csx3 [Leptolyngbya sp. 'hensonii']